MKVFITGISSGIGAALVELLVHRGHDVWGIARREPLMAQLAERLASPRFHFETADVRSVDDLRRVESAMHEYGFVPDAIVLNAGNYERDVGSGAFLPDVAANVWATNLSGSLRVLEVFLPAMLSRGTGQWVAISSLAAFKPDPWSSAYPAAKAAISMTFRSLRIQFAASGIQFKTLYLGPVATEIVPHYRDLKPSRHIPTPQKAAKAIARVLAAPAGEYYFPRLLSAIYRSMLWIPDRWFVWLMQGLRR